MGLSFFKLRLFSSPFVSLALAFLLNFVPWGNAPWVPDFLLVVLCFWVLQTPHQVNLLTAFLFGLTTDIQTAQPLGVHAIVYVSSCFLVIYWQRRLLNVSIMGQIFCILVLFLFAHSLLQLTLWGIDYRINPSWLYIFLPSGIEAFILWPLLKRFLSTRIPFTNHRPR